MRIRCRVFFVDFLQLFISEQFIIRIFSCLFLAAIELQAFIIFNFLSVWSSDSAITLFNIFLPAF